LRVNREAANHGRMCPVFPDRGLCRLTCRRALFLGAAALSLLLPKAAVAEADAF